VAVLPGAVIGSPVEPEKSRAARALLSCAQSKEMMWVRLNRG